MAVKKKGTNHGTFTTKIVKSVFILLATWGHDILCSEWGEKILHRSVHCVDLLSCTVHKSAHYFRTVNYRCFNYNFREFNFRCSPVLWKYFNNEIFPNYCRNCFYMYRTPSCPQVVAEWQRFFGLRCSNTVRHSQRAATERCCTVKACECGRKYCYRCYT